MKVDVIGNIYGRLEVISEIMHQSGRRVLCKCSCGTEKDILLSHLRSGKTVSCGCYRLERVKEVNSVLNTKHGMYGTRVYNIWNGMLDRVRDKEDPNYGGKGIEASEDWYDFSKFYSDMGDVPDGMSLDRIDPSGNYTKENCRWANNTLQAYNKIKNPRNTSGRTGVYKKGDKWYSTISKEGKAYHLGAFSEIDDAVKARELAEIKLYGGIKYGE